MGRDGAPRVASYGNLPPQRNQQLLSFDELVVRLVNLDQLQLDRLSMELFFPIKSNAYRDPDAPNIHHIHAFLGSPERQAQIAQHIFISRLSLENHR